MNNPRPHGPATSAATTGLNQSVLLGGNSAGQGQMYLRVSQKHFFCFLGNVNLNISATTP